MALGAVACAAYWFSTGQDQGQKKPGPRPPAVAVSHVGTAEEHDPPVAGDPVKVSTRVVDFGQVPLHFPVHQTLFVLNSTGQEVRASGIRLRSPFRAGQGSLTLDPSVSTGLEITFDPKEAGVYQERLTISLGKPVNETIEVIVRGEAILSPLDAGVPIPPPPDQAIRQYREREMERILAEAGAAMSHEAAVAAEGEESGGEGAEDGDGEDAAPSDDTGRGSADDRRGSTNPAALYPAVIAAFGLTQTRGEDINNVPAPIPPGDTKPKLPPPTADSSGSSLEQGTSQKGEDNEDQDDSGSQGGDDGEGNGGQGDDPPRKVPTLTVAPNSSLLVFSSREPLDLQAFPVTFLPDAGLFRMDGRMWFPDLALAFGETVRVRQFDDLVGTLSPDGSIQMKVTLRLDDPNGAVVLDLPFTLTTGMAVGYSAEGRVMFANGVPRDPVTGDVKLVGIANIPLGAGSSLDKAPVYLELLGRLQLGS